MNYSELLLSSANKSGNILCMGLDPVTDVLPHPEKPITERICDYFEELFQAMCSRGLVPAAFKPNLGYYAMLDRPLSGRFEGSLALARTLAMLRELVPHIPVILDAKRGDIATSSTNYAREAFESWQADCVTVSPYMGTDSVMPFALEEKGVYVLDRTSNPGGADLQNRRMEEAEPLYITVARTIAAWHARHSGIGAVVGATNLKELEDIAAFFADKDIPMLIPGVGSQGGSAPEVMAKLRGAGYPIALARINSSSGITHPWKKAPAPADYAERALANLEKLIGETSL